MNKIRKILVLLFIILGIASVWIIKNYDDVTNIKDEKIETGIQEEELMKIDEELTNVPPLNESNMPKEETVVNETSKVEEKEEIFQIVDEANPEACELPTNLRKRKKLLRLRNSRDEEETL